MQSNQGTAFWQLEGDAWWRRNRHLLCQSDTPTALPMIDVPLRLLAGHSVRPGRILEVGCTNGWRLWQMFMLHAISHAYEPVCVGVDPSGEAIKDGRQRFPQITLKRGMCCDLPVKEGDTFDLVIAGFFLYVVDRPELMRSLTELDRVTADGGHLLIYDFLPDHPTKTAYRDVPGLYSYKLDYAAVFLATGLYREVDRIIYDHDTHEIGDAPSDRRAGCVLLVKEGLYAD